MASSQQIETVGSGAEKAKLGFVGLLVIGAVAAYYVLGSQGHGAVVQWLTLCGGLLAAAAVFFVLTQAGHRLRGFLRDVVMELKKVVWPGRKETLQMTGVVFVFVLVMAIFLWLTDKTLEWVLYSLILGWR